MSETVLTVADLVHRGRQRTPDRIAARMRGGRAVTYAELDQRTDRVANFLIARGLVAGDRIATWMNDCLEYVELYLAAAKAGFVIVPINARFVVEEAAHPIADSGARALAWTPDLAERVAGLQLPADLLRIVTGPRCEGAIQFEELVAASDDAIPEPPRPDDLYIIGYTSGTTGRPKGAMLTHRSVLAIARMHASAYRLPMYSVAALTGSMSFVATVPAHHMAHLYMGGTLVIMGKWDVPALLQTVRNERATFTYIPTPLLLEFAAAAAADPAAWESLETVLHSGSQADPDHLRALCAVVGDRFVEGIGMTENSGGLATATTRADIRELHRRPWVLRSVGRAVVEALVEVVDEHGVPVPHDGETVGELTMKTPALMDGYWNLPDATASALRDGWYHSGDLASIDADGYVYLSDRRTDLIVSGGMNVYPNEVEMCIARLHGVEQVAVVGVPHVHWGHAVAAAVVAAPGADLDADAIVAHCREHLASYKKPLWVRFYDELPRTASLKLRRSVIRDRVSADIAASTSSGEGIDTVRNPGYGNNRTFGS
jgi:fatty-acyl-CoA synthase